MKLYGTIEKYEAQEDGSIIIEGIASSGAIDSDGEIITPDAMKAAMPDYMKFANIREMHQPKAAGIALAMDVQEDGRTFLKARIVDGGAVKKVAAGVYKGFSIGGKVTKRDEKNSSIIKGIRLSEISLVDRPANPEAVFNMWKGEGIEGDELPAVDAAAKADAVNEADAAAKDEAIKKSLWDVARLAELLQSLTWLEESCETESAIEGDGSSVPAQLSAAVKALAAVLRAMVNEEAAEIVGDTEGEATDAAGADDVALADKAAELEKAEALAKKFEFLAESLPEVAQGQKGQLIKCAKMAREHFGKEVAEAEDFSKVAGERDELKKTVDALNKQIAELKAKPAAAKAVLKTVTVDKTDDAKEVTKAEDEPTDTVSLIKKAHKLGGTTIMKL